MGELILPPRLSAEIAAIYKEMAEQYDVVAEQIPLTCQGCPDNCCDSYFLHYTYAEWAYLWEGLRALGKEVFARILTRAREYVQECEQVLEKGERPQINCPLLDDGLCGLYFHRLMICRNHGVPATLTRPDGQQMRFPGCFRCQEIVEQNFVQETDAPAMERTRLFRRLAMLESEFLGNMRHLYPRLKMTIAEMIVNGPPQDIESCLKSQENA